MKESRYIELLNLYLDHQLTPLESAELETEVLRDPERRRLYGQYCRMQKACTVLFEAERSLAPKTAAAVTAINGDAPATVAFPGWSLFGTRGVQFAGFAAAAACIAFVVIKIIPQRGSSDLPSKTTVVTLPTVYSSEAGPKTSVASTASSGSSDLAVSIPAAAETSARRSDFHPVFIANASLRNARAFESDPVAQQQSSGLEWLNLVAFPTVRSPRAEDLTFEPVPLKQAESRAYSGRRPFPGQAEMSSFQFQR